MEQRSHKLSIAVATILLAAGSGVQAEESAAPDTSAWACKKCTFAQGYTSDAELGAGGLDDSSAKFGDYTGLDEDGAESTADEEVRNQRHRPSAEYERQHQIGAGEAAGEEPAHRQE